MAAREEFLKDLKRNPFALYYASAELQGDREIVMEAVKQDESALQCASVELQGDREIVMEAVKQDGGALEYASVELKGDREIVMAAVAQCPDACLHAPPGLRNGGLRTFVAHLASNVYNVQKHTFIATVLFGAKAVVAPAPLPPGAPEAGLCDNSACVLSLLRPSTRLPSSMSLQAKRLIWEYAGVRSGAEWKTIDAAAANLETIRIWYETRSELRCVRQREGPRNCQ